VGLGRLTSPLSALVLVAAMVPFFTSLRVLSRTKGLMRMMPFTTSQVRTAASIVPAILALVWALATIPAFHGIGDAARMDWFHAVLYALVTAAAGFIGAIRWVSAKPADYSTPMVATQAGAMPPSLMFNLLRGLDMVALITIWLVLGLSPWIGVVAAILASVSVGLASVVCTYIWGDKVLDVLLTLVGATIIVTYTSTIASQFILRRRADAAGEHLPLRLWGYPWVPIVSALVVLGIVVLGMTADGLRQQLLSTFALTLVIYLIGRVHVRRKSAVSSETSVTADQEDNSESSVGLDATVEPTVTADHR